MFAVLRALPAEWALNQRERQASVKTPDAPLLPKGLDSVLGRPAVFILNRINIYERIQVKDRSSISVFGAGGD